MTYWVRSLVPILANAVRARIGPASSAALGTSTMTPAVVSRCTWQRSTKSSVSATVDTIGAVTHTSAVSAAAACATALSWSSSTPGLRQDVRGLRTPSAGLGSSCLQGGERLAVLGDLFINRRRLRAVEEAELDAEQSDAFGAAVGNGPGSFGLADVRQQGDPVTVTGTPGAVENVNPRGKRGRAGNLFIGGLEGDRTGCAIDQDERGGHQPAGALAPTTAGMPCPAIGR